MTTAPAVPVSHARPWLALIGISILSALAWVTESNVPIALPAIGRDIGGTMDALQWTMNAFLLAGAFIIVGGRLGDLFGRRRILTAGVGLLAAGSVVSAAAGSVGVLVAGRALAGLGAALLLPTALALIATLFTGRQRALAISVWISVCWGAQAVGPLVGGVLLKVASWPWLFWVNLPVLALGWVITWWATPESKDAHARGGVDIPGALTLVGGIGVLVFALVSADTLPVAGLLALAGLTVALLVAFVVIERRVANPLVHLSIFSMPRFDGAVIANLIANFVFAGALFFMALYLQVVDGYDPLTAGLLLLPATVPILLLNPVGTWMGTRFGPRGPVLVGMGFLVAAALYLVLYIGDTYSSVLPAFLLLGLGIGFQITPCAVTAVEDPGEAGEGVVSGVFKSSSMIGGALGVAVGTAVFQVSARQGIADQAGQVDPEPVGKILDALTGTATLDEVASLLGPQARVVLSSVFDQAVAAAMWPSVAAAALGMAAAVLLLRRRARSDASAPVDSAA